MALIGPFFQPNVLRGVVILETSGPYKAFAFSIEPGGPPAAGPAGGLSLERGLCLLTGRGAGNAGKEISAHLEAPAGNEPLQG